MAIELVILDRDNTITFMPPGQRYRYGADPIRFLPTVPRAIRILNQRHITVVVASNQQGIALDEYPLMTLESVGLYNRRINDLLAPLGAHIDRFYICPHKDSDGCNCRKPKPGLILQALDEYKMNPESAVMIGNHQTDIDAGRAGGVRSIAVPCPPDSYIQPGIPCFKTLLQAVKEILR